MSKNNFIFGINFTELCSYIIQNSEQCDLIQSNSFFPSSSVTNSQDNTSKKVRKHLFNMTQCNMNETLTHNFDCKHFCSAVTCVLIH